ACPGPPVNLTARRPSPPSAARPSPTGSPRRARAPGPQSVSRARQRFVHSLRRSVIEQHFGESSPFSVGIEEEVMILDAETLLLSPSVEIFLRDAERLELPGKLKTELFASVVELNTDTCASVAEAGEAVAALRRRADEIA